MQEARTDTADPTHKSHAGGYDFHDPYFVEWWLRSLYLLPAETQVSAALSLRGVITVPEVLAEIDHFLSLRGEGPLTTATATSPGMAGGTEDGSNLDHAATPSDVVLRVVQQIWRERPAFIWLGGIAAVVLVARGIKALGGLMT